MIDYIINTVRKVVITLYPLHSLYLEKNCQIVSIDEQQDVILNYQNKTVKIPYEQWKKIEDYTLSYFYFHLEKAIQQYHC